MSAVEEDDYYDNQNDGGDGEGSNVKTQAEKYNDEL